jgi:hypothetical protein
MQINTIKRDASEICSFCSHPWSHHHKGCTECFAIPSTHGLYCDGPLCSCVEFMEETLSDSEVAALMGESA